jgi:hypothetical protein
LNQPKILLRELGLRRTGNKPSDIQTVKKRSKVVIISNSLFAFNNVSVVVDPELPIRSMLARMRHSVPA